MQVDFINWKLSFENPADMTPHEFFRVFNTWIPQSPEVFVDVSDYKHVVEGPLVLLAGHHVHYALDNTDKRHGFLYNQKFPLEGNNVEKIRGTLAEFLKACLRLEKDTSFKAVPRFNTQELEFIVNSRSLAPNTEETFAAIKGELSQVLDAVFGAGQYDLVRNTDPRQRFSVIVKAKSKSTLTALEAKLHP